MDETARSAMLRRSGGRNAREISLVPGLLILEASAGRSEQAVRRLRLERGVRYAEVDRPVRACAQETPYGISMIDAPGVWVRWGNGGGARVAVIDSGVDPSHPDLLPPAASISYVAGGSPDDFYAHGTHVAGIILAMNNSIGVVGAAPSSSLLVARILDNDGDGLMSDAIAAIAWAVSNNASVVNMSFGNAEYSQAFADACQSAASAGVLLVAGAGNTGDSSPFYPAQYPGVMAVSAVDSGGAFAVFSSFGPHISVAAPGVDVRSTVPIVGWHAGWNAVTHEADQLRGGTVEQVTAPAYDCGIGESASDFPPAIAGSIAHIRRSGSVGLATQVGNAVAAGAVGVVVSNDSGGPFEEPFSPHVNVPVASISRADGDDLIAHNGAIATLNQYFAGHDYGLMSGTSMSCAFVAGVAALIIGDFPPTPGLPPIPSASLQWILEQTASRPGSGRSDLYGWGIVNAERASSYVHGRLRCAGDFNADGAVDDADFSEFAAWYNNLIAAGGAYTDGDLSGDGLVDDRDFTLFASAYDRLVCP